MQIAKQDRAALPSRADIETASLRAWRHGVRRRNSAAVVRHALDSEGLSNTAPERAAWLSLGVATVRNNLQRSTTELMKRVYDGTAPRFFVPTRYVTFLERLGRAAAVDGRWIELPHTSRHEHAHCAARAPRPDRRLERGERRRTFAIISIRTRQTTLTRKRCCSAARSSWPAKVKAKRDRRTDALGLDGADRARARDSVVTR